MTNNKDLDSNILPFTNLASTASIIANCQSIRLDDLTLALMPTNQGKHREKVEGGYTRNKNQVGHQGGNVHVGNQRKQQGRHIQREG